MSLSSTRLRQIREKRGISQSDLAERCQIGEKGIWRYENGQGDPSADILGRIAQVLNISTDYLLGLSDVPEGRYNNALRVDEQSLLVAYNEGNGNVLFVLIADRLREIKGNS